MSGEQWGEAVERELVERCVGEMDLDCAWDDWRTQTIRDAIKAAHAAGVADTRRKVAEERAETFEEWRVTGKPGGGWPDYDFAWSPDRGHDNPETSARLFVELLEPHGEWEDGPHLSRRIVTRTEWEAIARGSGNGGTA